MKRKIKISEKYHFINVLDENIFQGCKVARLQNRGLFLVEDMRMKRERSAKRRMESAKCRPINDNIKEKKYYEFGQNKNEQSFKKYSDFLKNK